MNYITIDYANRKLSVRAIALNIAAIRPLIVELVERFRLTQIEIV